MTTDSVPLHSAWQTLLIRAVTALTVSVWLAFLLGMAGRWWWVADLFSHFRIQYAASLVICLAVLVAHKQWRVATAAAMGALIMGSSVLGSSGWSSQAIADSGRPFRFVTFNKYWHNDDAQRIGRYLEEVRADVIALQEVEATELPELLAHLPSYPHAYATTPLRHGVVLLSRWPLDQAQSIQLVPGGVHVGKARVDWQGTWVTVIGAHLHWPVGARDVSLRNAELKQLLALAHDVSDPLVIGGDFNITAWSPNFQQVSSEQQIRDCAAGRRPPVTWPTMFPLLGIRIDHCLHSAQWEVAQVVSGPALGSDHYPTVNDLRFVGESIRAASN